MTQSHVIVAGYGIVGRCTAEGLEREGFAVTILEINEATIKKQTALGRRAIHGDARNADDLRNAGIDTAETLVLTIPDENDAIEACRVAHGLHPKVFIVARTNFVSKGLTALRHGADHVVIEEVVTAEAMRDVVVKKLTNA
jgi:CPA2 family monovalent cation:H+ antiporter-2